MTPRTHTKIIATCLALPSWFILLWLWFCEAGRIDSVTPILRLKKLTLREASELPKVTCSSEDEVPKKIAGVWTSRQPLSVTPSLAQPLGDTQGLDTGCVKTEECTDPPMHLQAPCFLPKPHSVFCPPSADPTVPVASALCTWLP